MRNIVVTSIYELRYENSKGGMIYKSFPLLSETIQYQLFDDYQYYIFTNKETFDKYSIGRLFDRENVNIIFKELNSDFYVQNINPTRKHCFEHIDNMDRIYTVKNYSEVIFNKLSNLIDVAKDNPNSNILWMDSGLFGTSCHDGWRDYIRKILYNKTLLFDKIFEKINNFGFVTLLGERIHINYDLKNQLMNTYSLDNILLVPGGIFGGKSDLIVEYLNEYKDVILRQINTNNRLFSEQELLYILLRDKNVKQYTFEDWADFQKGILKLIDFYDERKYIKEKCYE